MAERTEKSQNNIKLEYFAAMPPNYKKVDLFIVEPHNTKLATVMRMNPPHPNQSERGCEQNDGNQGAYFVTVA